MVSAEPVEESPWVIPALVDLQLVIGAARWLLQLKQSHSHNFKIYNNDHEICNYEISVRNSNLKSAPEEQAD